MKAFPGNGYGSCAMCDTMFIKADGTLSCSCMTGYNTSLGNIQTENVAEFVRGPIVAHIRDCYTSGHEPFKMCSQCLVRMKAPVDPKTKNEIGLHVEPSNWCNLFCETCLCTSDRQSASPSPRCHLDVDSYERMLTDLRQDGFSVNMIALVGFGEPLFHPRIADLSRIGRSIFPKANIYIDTNGNFGAQKAREIANCGLDLINVAIDGVDQASYEKYRKGGSFSKVLAFTRCLADAISSSGSSTKLVWKYILFRWNDRDEQIISARRMAVELGIDIQFHYTVGANASLRKSDDVEALIGGDATGFYLDSSLRNNCDLPPNHPRSLEAWSEDEMPQPLFPLPPQHVDSFCMLAFNHLQITPGGTAKMCCIANENISKTGKPISIYRYALDDVWNSDYMIEARRSMYEERPVKACLRCDQEEAALGESRRLSMNSMWTSDQEFTRERVLQAACETGFRLSGHPTFYQLNMGNLCNLACRMCSGDYSSRIAADPVQSAWNPANLLDVPKWRDGWLTLGPRPNSAVDYDGFYAYQFDAEAGGILWSNGNSNVSMHLPQGIQLSKLKAVLRAPVASELTLRITLNGLELFFGCVGEKPVEVEADISDLVADSSFHLRFLSSTVGFEDDERNFGAGLLDLCLSCMPNTGAEKLSLTRFATTGGWWTQKEFMLNELFENPETLRYLILQGGEPLLNKETAEILDYLVARGVSKSIVLEVVSNFTHLTDQMLDSLCRFQRVELEASVDGIGPVFEYIRYPAAWSTIENNVRRVRALPQVNLSFVVAVQAYNLLNISDILEFCDRHEIRCAAHFLAGPIFLNVLVLPLSVRMQAQDRIRQARDRAASANIKAMADYLLHFLKQKSDIQYCDQIDNFMRFTNDLDYSRGQSFATVLPELVSAFEMSGYPWNPSRRFAHP